MQTIEEQLKRYAELKWNEKVVAEELEELKPIIKDHLETLGVDKLPTTRGIFSVEQRKTWKYTQAVEDLQEEEKATGKATAIISKSLRFTPPKKEE